MMPGAAHCISYEEAANKGGAIMRAHGANREHFIAATDKEHRFTAGVAEQHGSVRNGQDLNALREIWSVEFCFLLVHLISPVISRSSPASGD